MHRRAMHSGDVGSSQRPGSLSTPRRSTKFSIIAQEPSGEALGEWSEGSLGFSVGIPKPVCPRNIAITLTPVRPPSNPPRVANLTLAALSPTFRDEFKQGGDRLVALNGMAQLNMPLAWQELVSGLGEGCTGRGRLMSMGMRKGTTATGVGYLKMTGYTKSGCQLSVAACQ